MAAAPFNWEGHDLSLSLSYGAYCVENDEDVSAALANADRAMYINKRQAKANG